jgi:histidyl-tRNA synthetase
VLGEDELAQGKVKIKEMGLPEGHPDKEGIMVAIADLIPEVRTRIARQKGETEKKEEKEVAKLTQQMEDVKVTAEELRSEATPLAS